MKELSPLPNPLPEDDKDQSSNESEETRGQVIHQDASDADEIWEAHVRGELVGEAYAQALIGLAGRRKRALNRRFHQQSS